MANLPVLRPHEVVSRLQALGFVEVRQRGSHKQFRHGDGRGTTVPFHQGRDISPVLLEKSLATSGLRPKSLLRRVARGRQPFFHIAAEFRLPLVLLRVPKHRPFLPTDGSELLRAPTK